MVDNPYPIYTGRQTVCAMPGSLMLLLIIFIVGSFLAFFTGGYRLFYAGLAIILIFVVLIIWGWVFISLKSIKYSVNNVEFVLKGGVISRYEKILPYSKIQHVVVTRSLMQRILGLSTIVIQTASSHITLGVDREKDPFAGNPEIPGLDVNDAEKFRDYIIAQVLRGKSGQGLG